MAVVEAGLSTLGVKVGYALGTSTKPTAFTWLERCNAIGGIELTAETIDASALEDASTRSVQGRQDNGGEWSLTFNLTDEVQAQLETLISTYAGRDTGKVMWFEVWVPNMTDGCFVVAEVPSQIPLPDMGQNELLTVDITLTIEEYKGWDTGIEPTASSSSNL